MKFLVQLFLLSVLCIGLSSCEDDQDVVDSSSFRMILRVLISHYIWNKKIGLFVCSLYSLYREHFL